LDYPIHGSGWWGRVSGVYYSMVGLMGLALRRFLVIKNKNNKNPPTKKEKKKKKNCDWWAVYYWCKRLPI
jgi:hypothetical protein